MNVINLTALDYLNAEHLAIRNVADSQKFRQIKILLHKAPKVEERLAFEFFELAWLALQSGGNPVMPAFHAFLFRDKIGDDRRQEYAAWINRIIFKTFEMIGGIRLPIDEQNPIMLTFKLSLSMLRGINDVEFKSIANLLRRRCKNGATDSRLRIINEAMESRLQSQSRLSTLAKEVKLLQVQLEHAARANVN